MQLTERRHGDVPLRNSGPLPQQSDAAEGSRWAGVVLLALVSLCNIMDRNLPSVLGELIKRDLHLSDTALGLINGFGFLLVYAICAVPIARLADRKGYGTVIASCVGFWSLMTVLGGFAQSGWQLALTRTGVAMGEAGATPASHAYIANRFSETERGRPLAVFSLSAPLSIMIAMLAGGLLGQAIGWRWTFIVMGLLSLVVAPFVRIVLGRRTGVSAGEMVASLPETLRYLFGKSSFRWIIVGSTLIGAGSYGLLTFKAPFLMRVHGMSVAEVGVYYGLASALLGALMLLFTGIAVDRLMKRDSRWALWLLVLIVLCLLPTAFVAFTTDNQWLSLAMIALMNCIGIGYLVPVVTAIQRLSPSSMRGTASAVVLFAVSVIGGVGPLVVGLISDALTPQMGAAGLGRALFVVPAFFICAAFAFFAASRSFNEELVD